MTVQTILHHCDGSIELYNRILTVGGAVGQGEGREGREPTPRLSTRSPSQRSERPHRTAADSPSPPWDESAGSGQHAARGPSTDDLLVSGSFPQEALSLLIPPPPPRSAPSFLPPRQPLRRAELRHCPPPRFAAVLLVTPALSFLSLSPPFTVHPFRPPTCPLSFTRALLLPASSVGADDQRKLHCLGCDGGRLAHWLSSAAHLLAQHRPPCAFPVEGGALSAVGRLVHCPSTASIFRSSPPSLPQTSPGAAVKKPALIVSPTVDSNGEASDSDTDVEDDDEPPIDDRQLHRRTQPERKVGEETATAS